MWNSTPPICGRPTASTARGGCGPTCRGDRSAASTNISPICRPSHRKADPLIHAIIDTGSGKAVGVASYLRINPSAGTIEVGGLAYSPLLQRRPAATEAMYLMMRRAFDELGYRRYEWKCNALNAPSRAGATRLGFQFEGIFRQADVVKGRNRDTAWFAIIDREWPALRAAFERWLDPGNFDETGRQRVSLSSLTAGLGESGHSHAFAD
jgi:L-amino acid N-acyltransferase YncA